MNLRLPSNEDLKCWRMPRCLTGGAQHCSNSGTGHGLVVDDRGTGRSVFHRHARRCSTGLSSHDTELVAKGLPMFVPASHLAAAQSGQRQGKKKTRKRTFRGRSPSKPLPSPQPSYSEEADALMQKQSSSRRPVVSSPTPSPRSRRIAKAAAASAGFRTRMQGRAFRSSNSYSTAVMDERPPFSPCSPFKARDAISAKGRSSQSASTTRTLHCRTRRSLR